MKKPKLWNYKSGIKKGKLRNNSKKYLSFKLKEYYKRQRIIKEQFKEEIIYFINFELIDTIDNDTKVVGSLTSPFYIPLKIGKRFVNTTKHIPVNWEMVKFYEAEDFGIIKNIHLIVIRDDEEIINEIIKPNELKNLENQKKEHQLKLIEFSENKLNIEKQK